MRFGISMFPTAESIAPDELAYAVEERGFESLWFPEHSHIPVSRRSPWPGGAELPDMYRKAHDQFVALTAAACATSRIKLGTGVCLVAQHDPIWLAKTVASLDIISKGRVILGVGYGWNKEEMAHHGVVFGERRALAREKLLTMKSLWTDEEASFHGEHIDLEPSWSWPKPLQRPHPPILIGGSAGPRLFAAVAELADGWIPMGNRADVLERLPELTSALEDAGRDPASIEITVYGAPADLDSLNRFEDAGVARVTFGLPPAGRDEVLPLLDTYAKLIETRARS